MRALLRIRLRWPFYLKPQSLKAGDWYERRTFGVVPTTVEAITTTTAFSGTIKSGTSNWAWFFPEDDNLDGVGAKK